MRGGYTNGVLLITKQISTVFQDGRLKPSRSTKAGNVSPNVSETVVVITYTIRRIESERSITVKHKMKLYHEYNSPLVEEVVIRIGIKVFTVKL